ncbi:Methionyl-tRNA formyltransferase [Coccomyxa subellipsoidea C-169]|uniref:Methionyl-tRNA formyltransferase, mitochondrial n=1 Tax=Coccomyxa subellipsoidea (strain C-169) TaxID=574566 RepID=I0YT94_COCSC|nr:Methionyl-tRNA formyltransferase [Coccomyxa subellipsoidea C-169]EIE21613.1 Methionyl-tRNA formyltransferase [Coccomyxa subellipsoidea C-169]|eukprot:XP_005646157.1 Methionyl-tRNA formyltransferase [Coccomyxa subellipsoidea C-169]
MRSVSTLGSRCSHQLVCRGVPWPNQWISANLKTYLGGRGTFRGQKYFACAAYSADHGKHRVIFLGTPEVASSVLQQLLHAANEQDSTFEIAAIVTQPNRPKGRGNKKVAQPSPVAQLALDQGWPQEKILSPVKASEEPFLEQLAAIRPDLCITAAYGNILPKKFLAIPRFGTLNIHPSLLPRYRGAAPVQRAVQDGVRETGVTVAFTVRAMDAGPVLAQERVAVDEDIQAPELLADLFKRGSDLLLSRLPDVWSGIAAQQATPQDDAAATHAAKLEKADGQLDFREHAIVLHNKVRAFVGWPGTQATLLLKIHDGTADREVEVKITRTCVAKEDQQPPQGAAGSPEGYVEAIVDGQLIIPCGDASWLHILELQPAGKKPMPAAAFLNGVKGRSVFVKLI